MECQNPLIDRNGEKDIEIGAKRATVYDASPERKSASENKNHIKQSARQETGSSLFHRKAILLLIIIGILSLITIISITIWVIFIKKAETTVDTTTIGASTTETTILTTSMNSHPTIMNVSKFNKWQQNAITIAGGNGYGQKLNQLKYPEGILIDENNSIYIADRSNDRIVQWKWDTKKGQIVAGGNGEGSQINQLNSATDMLVGPENHSIIIADRGNRRVIQWLNQTQQILIDNIDCYGLAMDKHGFIYVSDHVKNEVTRWKIGKYKKGIVVAGANGQGNQLSQLNSPTFIFVDEDQSVYVSDYNNHRVMKWRKGAKEGIIVAGGNGQGGNLNQLYHPQGVIVDDLGQIYVADSGNHRVMRWCEGREEGEIVVGGNDYGNQSKQLSGPRGLTFDDEGNLYVADTGNFRIAKFEIIL